MTISRRSTRWVVAVGQLQPVKAMAVACDPLQAVEIAVLALDELQGSRAPERSAKDRRTAAGTV